MDFFSTFPFPLLKSSRSYRGVRNCFRDFWELIWSLFKPTGTCSNSVLRCYGCSALKAKSRKSRWTLVQSDLEALPIGIAPEEYTDLLRKDEATAHYHAELVTRYTSIPKHPWLLARFGMSAFLSGRAIARRFRSERTRALFAGLAAHSFLSLDEQLSGAMGMLMAVLAHAVGWPIPRGGSQSLTNALCRYLSTFESTLKTSSRVESLAALSNYDPILCDVTPRQLLEIGGARLSKSYRRQLASYRYGPGVFKVDYALNRPIPWKASECLRAATVHLGGSFEEIAAFEQVVRDGRHADHPFVLLAQPSLFDSSRAPEGKQTAWAYCHVPNGSNVDMLERLEKQIDRFAPGFRDCVLARRVFSPAHLEKMDANLVGGDIGGGAMDIRQFLFRPTWRHSATSARDIYICSSSTPPGGGVHGMCGYHAAKTALSKFGAR